MFQYCIITMFQYCLITMFKYCLITLFHYCLITMLHNCLNHILEKGLMILLQNCLITLFQNWIITFLRECLITLWFRSPRYPAQPLTTEDITTLRKIGNPSPNDKESHSFRPEKTKKNSNIELHTTVLVRSVRDKDSFPECTRRLCLVWCYIYYARPSTVPVSLRTPIQCLYHSMPQYSACITARPNTVPVSLYAPIQCLYHCMTHKNIMSPHSVSISQTCKPTQLRTYIPGII